MDDLSNIKKIIDRAKVRLMRKPNTTFYSALLSSLHMRIDTDRCETMATNGVEIFINPNYVRKITLNETEGVLVHEVEHVVNDHVIITKEGNLCPDASNIAQDHYINLRLLALGYSLPGKPYADPKYKGWSSMKIYYDIVKSGQKINPALKDILAPPAGMSAQEHREAVTSNIVKAVMAAQAAEDYGSIPGHIMRKVEEVLNPKLPWDVILQNYMTEYFEDDYSWARPNRRYLPDFYLPKISGTTIDLVTGGCDVSGSMSAEDISAIYQEYRYIWEILQPKRGRFMTFDTEVHMNQMYNQGDVIEEFVLEGGGGTNVVPLLDSIRKEEPRFALIFTDGYFATPDMSGIESTDIYWIIKGNPSFTASKGIIIHYEPETKNVKS